MKIRVLSNEFSWAPINLSHPIALTMAFVTCLAVYWSGLHGPFVLDDKDNLIYLLSAKLTNKDIVNHLISSSGHLGRPVSMASFSINAILSQNIFYWKLTNLAIHLMCGFLIYHLSIQLINLAGIEDKEEKSRNLALVVALIWLLHPLQVSTVLYTVQRMTQLSALFVLAALLSYLIARKRQVNSQSFICHQVLAWCVFFPLGIFSKENALLLPLFILLFELFLIQRDRISNNQMSIIMLIIGICATALILFKAESLIASFSRREYSLYTQVLTEPRVLVSYLEMLIIPSQKNLSFLHDDITLSKSLFAPATTILSIIAIAFLITITFYFRKKQPLFSTSILFFFVGHLMESTIFPLELMFEHRNYLPSFGIFLAVSSTFSQYFKDKIICRFITILLLLLLTFNTLQRSNSWSSPERLFYGLEIYKNSSERLAAVLTEQAIIGGDYQLAREKLKNIHTAGAAIRHLYIDCLEKKSLPDNLFTTDYNFIDNYAVMGIFDLANLGLDSKCYFSPHVFLNWIDRILAKRINTDANRQGVMVYKAHYLWGINKKFETIKWLKDTYSIDTRNLIPLFMACDWSINAKFPTAKEICPNAITLGKKSFKFEQLALEVEKRYINFIIN